MKKKYCWYQQQIKPFKSNLPSWNLPVPSISTRFFDIFKRVLAVSSVLFSSSSYSWQAVSSVYLLIGGWVDGQRRNGFDMNQTQLTIIVLLIINHQLVKWPLMNGIKNEIVISLFYSVSVFQYMTTVYRLKYRICRILRYPLVSTNILLLCIVSCCFTNTSSSNVQFNPSCTCTVLRFDSSW